MQPTPNLIPANIDELNTEMDVVSNPYDLRHDLHAFFEYMEGRSVKRLHRSNELNQADKKRLAKLMSDSSAIEEIKSYGFSNWLWYVDELARLSKFVNYATEGVYAGYTSSEPSFPDNYIKVNTKIHEEFTNLPLIEQEKKLFNQLVKSYDYNDNEFYNVSVLGKLSCFTTRGSATGVMPGLDFARARQFLFNILESCTSGVWYTTSSLIQYLKEHHPFFLIPENPEYESERDIKDGRYGNFYEGKTTWYGDTQIPEGDADAFERVEGRYVERFLEGLPLILGYAEVAYSKVKYKGYLPEMNQLLAFRINDTFLRAMNGEIIEPKVTVQPNFEVHVESELYPVRIIAKLSKLADVVTKDKTSILKLQKKKVLTQLSEREDLDVIKLLEDMSGQKLPQNVRIELEEWVGASEAFTLYENAVLFEGDKELSEIDQFTIERISPTIRIVHSPDRLFAHLEQKELIPLHIKHRSSALMSLPDGTRTVFSKRGLSVSKSKTKKKQRNLWQ